MKDKKKKKSEIHTWKNGGYTNTSTHVIAVANLWVAFRLNSPTHTQQPHTQLELGVRIGSVSWAYGYWVWVLGVGVRYMH